MKTKVLIIEDNYYKFFTTKQVLETQLKLQIDTRDVHTGKELVQATQAINPDLIVLRPNGGVTELLEKMKKKRANRRNTEITILLANDVDDELVRKFESYVASILNRRVADAA